MPSSIPYDPSLVLTGVVNAEAIGLVKKIAAAQAKADSFEAHYNSLLVTKRSLDMTKAELANSHVPTTALDKAMAEYDTKLDNAAARYASAKIDAEFEIQPLRAKVHEVHVDVESPVDYIQSEIKTMPLSADSINMDVQYFSLDSYGQNSAAFASAISGFVNSANDFLGQKTSAQLSAAVHKQAIAQAQNHKIVGSLVISVACTHKNAAVLAPFVLNVDKAIKVWNHIFSGKGKNGKDHIDVSSRESMKSMLTSERLQSVDEPNATEHMYSIISGMTFGSSFVGMVHILNTSSTVNSEALTNGVMSLQSQMNEAGWFENACGGYGVNASLGSDIKNLLSTQNVQSHVTMACMGAIPSIKSSELRIGVKCFADFDPKATINAIATIQNATVADQTSVVQAADQARTGQSMLSMRANDIKSSLSALGEIDETNNKVLDINSMMAALDDYLQKAAAGESGIPINYYLSDITKGMLVEMWLTKYFPEDVMGIQLDDSKEIPKNTSQPTNPSDQPQPNGTPTTPGGQPDVSDSGQGGGTGGDGDGSGTGPIS